MHFPSSRILRRTDFRLTLCALLAVTLLAAGRPAAHAQVTATLQTPQLVVPAPTTGLLTPQSVAVDNSGNIYIADTGNSDIVEVTAAGVASVLNLGTPGGLALKNPQGVAIDNSGFLYVTDTGNNRILKLQGGGVVLTFSNNPPQYNLLNQPAGITVDQGDNVFITNLGTNTVVEIPNGLGGIPTQITTTGLSNPTSIAVDTTDNLFVADTGNGRVVEIPSGAAQQTLPITGLVTPTGVLLDTNHNLYVSDSTNNNVVEISAASGTQTTVSTNGLAQPQGLAIDGYNNLYIADKGNNRVVEENVQPSLNLGSAAVGGTGTPMTLNYTVNGYIGSSYTPSFQLIYGKDATLGAVTCTGGAAPETCSVGVTLKPALPGPVADAVQVQGAGGSGFLANTLVYGTGQAPLGVFAPGTAAAIGTSNLSTNLYGVAVDRLGNVFVAQEGTTQVVKIPAGNGTQTSVPVTGLQYATGLAVDGAGDIYVADAGQGAVIELPAGGGPQVTIAAPVNGNPLVSPTGVAVDGAGDLFIADFGNSDVVEVPANGSAPSQVGSGFNAPFGVAVDGSGNVYVGDTGNNRIVKVSLATGTQTVVTVSVGGLGLTLVGSGPTLVPGAGGGLAVDAAGDLFIADTGNNRIVEVPAGGGPQTALLATGLSNPTTLALDGMGNVYVVDTSNQRIVEINRSVQALSFGTTNVGQNSPQQVVTEQNIGNTALSFSALSITPNFNLNGVGTTCLNSTTLAAGAACGLGVQFAPTTAGPLTGTVNLTTNGLNTVAPTYTPQQITLNGTGVSFAATITLAENPGTSVVFGTAVTVTATVTGGNGIPTGNITYTVDGGSPVTVALSPTGVGTFVLPGTLAVGSHTIVVNYGGDADYTVPTPPAGFTLLVSIDGTTTALTASATNVVFGQNVTFTATVKSTSTGTPAGMVTFYNGATAIGTGTLNASGVATLMTSALPVGTDVITATYGATTDFASSTSPAVDVTVTGAVPIMIATTTTLMANPTTIPSGSSDTLTATVSSASGMPTGTVTFTTGSTTLGSGTLSGGVATLSTTNLPVGTDTVTATYAGTTTYGASSGTASVTVTALTPAITLALSAPSLTVTQGSSATDNLTITSDGGYSGTLQVACKGLPALATCSFAPATASLSGTGTTAKVVITIKTTGSSSTAELRPLEPTMPSNLPIIPATVFWMPGWLMAAIAGKKRKLSQRARHMLILMLLLGGVGLMTACGGGSMVNQAPTPPTTPVTPTGTYAVQVVVTGTGNITQSANLSLIVN